MSSQVRELITRLDFGNTLLHGMLGSLLFAGALHIDVTDLGTGPLLRVFHVGGLRG